MTNFLARDGYFPADLVREAGRAWPGPDWPGWYGYTTDDEIGKRTCADQRAIPAPALRLLGLMATLPVDLLLAIPPAADALAPDLSLHGGGMHDMAPGSRLGVHLDADRHPRLGLERRANAVLFLSDWHESWGGELQFWKPDLSGPEASVVPAAGRLVLFETSDDSYHGVARVACPQKVRRKSLSLFWWGPPSDGAEAKRPRALFVRAAGEAEDAARDAARRARAGLPRAA